MFTIEDFVCTVAIYIAISTMMLFATTLDGCLDYKLPWERREYTLMNLAMDLFFFGGYIVVGCMIVIYVIVYATIIFPFKKLNSIVIWRRKG